MGWPRRHHITTTRPCTKLNYKKLDPFRINQVTFRLAFPQELRIHNVFHVSLLELQYDNLLQRLPWSCRQGRSTTLTKSSTLACIVNNFNIWSYGKIAPLWMPVGNRLHIYKMLQRPFELFINGTLRSRPRVLGDGLRGRIMS